jgi:hypothetical protein
MFVGHVGSTSALWFMKKVQRLLQVLRQLL